ISEPLACASMMLSALLALLLPQSNEPAPAPAPAAGQPFEQQVRDCTADLRDLERRYDVPLSPARWQRLREYLRQKEAEVAAVDAALLSRDGRIDRWLLLDHLRHELARLDLEESRAREIAPLLPHGAPLIAACEARRRLEPVAGEAAAALLAAAAKALGDAAQKLAHGDLDAVPVTVARAADERLQQLHGAVRDWYRFHDGYDPSFTWWARAPWQEYDAGQERWRTAVRKRLVDDRTGDSRLVGERIGEQARLAELRHERIPYAPAELVAIAEKEFAWCDAEMQKASRDLGCGDDWHQALERVKQQHVPPGEQPQLVARLAQEAIDFLRARDLVTLPPLPTECWRMSMMSPQAQKVNRFFLGGETIQVSFPTDAMSQEQKLQSMRSNNEPFSRATVFHELIPGHWLQQYAQERWHTYRAPFDTPFWVEGWALYWEFRLYDLGLIQSAADKVGALYWRKHRCARIVFSLNFHLGRWTAPQCVDYLVERVGHERAAAEGEVRRSIGGGYAPLYQCAYMLGGLQLRALHDELVGPGKRTEKQFHDAVLQQNAIPIAYVRAALSPQEPP